MKYYDKFPRNKEFYKIIKFNNNRFLLKSIFDEENSKFDYDKAVESSQCYQIEDEIDEIDSPIPFDYDNAVIQQQSKFDYDEVLKTYNAYKL